MPESLAYNLTTLINRLWEHNFSQNSYMRGQGIAFVKIDGLCENCYSNFVLYLLFGLSSSLMRDSILN
jgi:hypothetical protein